MTQQEFTARTGYMPTSEEEFWRIHEAYCDSSADKDVWCKAWAYMYDNFGDAPGLEDATDETYILMDGYVEMPELMEDYEPVCAMTWGATLAQNV